MFKQKAPEDIRSDGGDAALEGLVTVHFKVAMSHQGEMKLH